jgi:hypothetical protein
MAAAEVGAPGRGCGFDYRLSTVVFAAWAATTVVALFTRLSRNFVKALVVAGAVIVIWAFVSVFDVPWPITAIMLIGSGSLLGVVAADFTLALVYRPKHRARPSGDVR